MEEGRIGRATSVKKRFKEAGCNCSGSFCVFPAMNWSFR